MVAIKILTDKIVEDMLEKKPNEEKREKRDINKLKELFTDIWSSDKIQKLIYKLYTAVFSLIPSIQLHLFDLLYEEIIYQYLKRKYPSNNESDIVKNEKEILENYFFEFLNESIFDLTSRVKRYPKASIIKTIKLYDPKNADEIKQRTFKNTDEEYNQMMKLLENISEVKKYDDRSKIENIERKMYNLRIAYETLLEEKNKTKEWYNEIAEEKWEEEEEQEKKNFNLEQIQEIKTKKIQRIKKEKFQEIKIEKGIRIELSKSVTMYDMSLVQIYKDGKNLTLDEEIFMYKIFKLKQNYVGLVKTNNNNLKIFNIDWNEAKRAIETTQVRITTLNGKKDDIDFPPFFKLINFMIFITLDRKSNLRFFLLKYSENELVELVEIKNLLYFRNHAQETDKVEFEVRKNEVKEREFGVDVILEKNGKILNRCLCDFKIKKDLNEAEANKDIIIQVN